MFTERILTKIGYLETTLPFPYYNQLLQNINENPPTEVYAYELAGQMENEKILNFSLIPKEIKNIIIKGCREYINIFGHKKFNYNDKKWDIKFKDNWINFQKAGEYNPIHNHGGDLVYVIWLQIPYNLEDELNHPSCKNSKHKIASKFQFTNILNPFSDKSKIVLDVDKTYEGKMIIFHSDMQHCVYPFFTSDDYRISMSGNLDIVFEP